MPASQPLLDEWVEGCERTWEVPTLAKTRWAGKQRLAATYRWLHELPLRDSDDALHLGWCEPRPPPMLAGQRQI